MLALGGEGECKNKVLDNTTPLICWPSSLNSVGTSDMHTYWASAFILPKMVMEEIEKLCRGFLWGSTAEKRRPALLAWDDLCAPKKNGGLGLKQIQVWNMAALGKQVWALMMKKDALWVKWISTIYLKNEDFLDVQIKNSDSWHWKQVLKVRNALWTGLCDPHWNVIKKKWHLLYGCSLLLATELASALSVSQRGVAETGNP